MPQKIFNLGMNAGEIAVYAYLMFRENRKTYQCYPSCRTIGEAVGMSRNTVKKYVDALVDKRMRFTVRESTLDGYRRIAEHYIKSHLGDKKIGSVTTADIQKMYIWLRENGRVNEHYEKGNALSDSSIRRIHMMLHQAMDAAVQERIIVKNSTVGTVIPKANYAPKKILTEAQLQKFLDVVRQDNVWSDFFYTELTTGMRRGEICGLKWQDFDEKTGRLQIRRAVTS